MFGQCICDHGIYQLLLAGSEGSCGKIRSGFDTPFKDLPEEFKKVLLYGTGDEKLTYTYTSRNGTVQNRSHTFEGIINNLERRYRETRSDWIKEKMEKYMSISTCGACGGRRLKPELLAVTIGGKNIIESAICRSWRLWSLWTASGFPILI